MFNIFSTTTYISVITPLLYSLRTVLNLLLQGALVPVIFWVLFQDIIIYNSIIAEEARPISIIKNKKDGATKTSII